MISSMDLKENALENKLHVIDEYAQEVNLKKSIKAKLKKSLEYSASKSGSSWAEKMNILYEMPKILRYEIALAMHNGAARKLSFFFHKDQTVVASIVPMLQPMRIEAQGYVYQTGSTADEVFFLVKGIIRIIANGELIIRTIKNGEYFGNIEVMRRTERRFDALAYSSSDLLVMNKQMLNRIEYEYSYIWQEIFDNAMENEREGERIILHLGEIKKWQSGEVIFLNFDEEYPRHLERLLVERIQSFDYGSGFSTVSALVKKCDHLIRLAKRRKARGSFMEEISLMNK